MVCDYTGRWLSDLDYSVHQTLPANIKDEILPLFKCEPVLCDHDPPPLPDPDPACENLDPANIHNCPSKQFPPKNITINQPGLADDSMKQYETTVDYMCPDPAIKQYEIEYLRNNFSFVLPDVTTPSTYVQNLTAYCEIDK